jgi:hypothetical protein
MREAKIPGHSGDLASFLYLPLPKPKEIEIPNVSYFHKQEENHAGLARTQKIGHG